MTRVPRDPDSLFSPQLIVGFIPTFLCQTLLFIAVNLHLCVKSACLLLKSRFFVSSKKNPIFVSSIPRLAKSQLCKRRFFQQGLLAIGSLRRKDLSAEQKARSFQVFSGRLWTNWRAKRLNPGPSETGNHQWINQWIERVHRFQTKVLQVEGVGDSSGFPSLRQPMGDPRSSLKIVITH